MTFQHEQLAAGRWQELSFMEQMANIGSEVERTIKWKNKGNAEYSKMAFERALELIDLTVGANKQRGRRKEVLRVREIFADYFFDNNYHSTDIGWSKYFYAFNHAARANK